MNARADSQPFIAIACGGTGGHLFPGVAVADELRQRGASVALLISPKEVDQTAVRTLPGMEWHTLPAVGWQNGNHAAFGWNFLKSLRAARALFQRRRPAAVLAMGGFTSAPPVLAGKWGGARVFLHESNTIPGRANRWLARWVDEAFAGFPEAAGRLRCRATTITGTPVRFASALAADPAAGARQAECRRRLGLLPDRPTVLVVGGSQGASGLNRLILAALPALKHRDWQWLHLTGRQEVEQVRAAQAALGVAGVALPFLAEMDLALGAATACVSRAGASSLAELAAARLPALLVPFPAAADDHQSHNAAAFSRTGAARVLAQGRATPESVALELTALMEHAEIREAMQTALAGWHAPAAAAEIAGHILQAVERRAGAAPAELVAPAASAVAGAPRLDEIKRLA